MAKLSEQMSAGQAMEIRMAIITRIGHLKRMQDKLAQKDPVHFEPNISELQDSINRQKQCYDSLFTRPINEAFPNV